jgi:hypothetical protein
LSLLGSILTGCLSADGITNPGREHQLIRFNHKNDDSSRSILKKFFLPYPVRDDIDAQPIWKGICIEGAIDGKHKSYLCPSRICLADGTPTTEVILQMCVTDCTTRRIDCYARKDDVGLVYRVNNFMKDFREEGKFTDYRYPVDYDEAKQQFLDFIKTQHEYKRVGKGNYSNLKMNKIYQFIFLQTLRKSLQILYHLQILYQLIKKP